MTFQEETLEAAAAPTCSSEVVEQANEDFLVMEDVPNLLASMMDSEPSQQEEPAQAKRQLVSDHITRWTL